MNIRNLYKSFYTKNFSQHSFLFITIVSFFLRMVFFAWPSGDYIDYLHPWFEQIKQNGGIDAIGEPIGNYMVSYIYILALLTYLPLPDIVSIKIVSCIGDIILAFYCMKLSFCISHDCIISKIVYVAIIYSPLVILNSSAWAQCDSLYTAALIAFLHYISVNDSKKAIFSISIAFCLKLQTVFLAPIVLVAFLKGKIKWKHVFYAPLIYLLMIFPAYIQGRSLKSLILLYFYQAKTYTALSMNAPNFYAWFPWQYTNKKLEILGIVAAFIITLILPIFIMTNNLSLDGINLVKFALYSATLLPFVLPHMHERYFYLASVLSLIYIICGSNKANVYYTINICSFLLTVRFVFGALWISAAVLSIPMAIVCFFLTIEVYNCKNSLLMV